MGDHGRDVGFSGDIAFDGFEAGWVGKNLVHFCVSFGEGGFGDVGHEDRGALAGEKHGGF